MYHGVHGGHPHPSHMGQMPHPHAHHYPVGGPHPYGHLPPHHVPPHGYPHHHPHMGHPHGMPMPGYPPHGHHMGGPPMHHHPSHPMPHANFPRSSRLPTSSNQSNVDKNSRKKDKSKIKSIPVSKSMGNVKPPYVKKSTGVKWTKEEVSILLSQISSFSNNS